MNQSEAYKYDLLKEKVRLYVHDMNGLLTSISGYNDLAVKAEPSEALELRKKIKDAADKAYQLNRKLGSFCINQENREHKPQKDE